MSIDPHLAPVKSKGGWLKWALGGCGCLLFLAAVAILLISFFTKGILTATAEPEKAVKEFLAAAGAQNYEAAYDYFSDPLKQSQSFEDFQSMVQGNPELFQVTDTTFNSRSIDLTEGAKLSGTVTLQNGNEMPASFHLIKEGERWKLISYNIGSSG